MPLNSADTDTDTVTRLPRLVGDARADALARVAGGVNLVMIGAGINGAGVAWDASLRGLRVLLLDKAYIGSGTSSWSSRRCTTEPRCSPAATAPAGWTRRTGGSGR
jgi:FAD dependent oxidoreductase